MLQTNYKISRPVPTATFRALSLGAGVQSTVLALLAAKGLIGPQPDCMIFADTQWEPKAIYDHLDWLENEIVTLTAGRMPLYRVSHGDIRANILETTRSVGKRFVALPFYTKDGGMGQRQCTSEYKIKPIRRKLRALVGLKKFERAKNILVEQWLGISMDELERVKDNSERWVVNRWPLLEIQWTRQHCQTWFQRHYPHRRLVKSSCIGCPFHSNAFWRDMKRHDPVSWHEAVAIDRALRHTETGTLRGMKQPQYMHRSCVALDCIDFDNLEDKGQLSFLGECEGMCGV